MPLDAIYLSALTAELKDKLVGGRIDKVQQPERDMLLLSLRAKGENLRLLLAAGTGNARVHLTESSFENPAEPPMFCMLLRKHLLGARLTEITQLEMERCAVFTFDCTDEMVFPGVAEVLASLLLWVSMLIRLDLPTLLLPIKAYSGKWLWGHWLTMALLMTYSADFMCMCVCV